MNVFHRIALALVIIGAINWGLIGFFRYDLVSSIFGGETALFSRVIFALVGISGIACIPLLFHSSDDTEVDHVNNGYGNVNYGTEFGEEEDFSDVKNYSKKNSDKVE